MFETSRESNVFKFRNIETSEEEFIATDDVINNEVIWNAKGINFKIRHLSIHFFNCVLIKK